MFTVPDYCTCTDTDETLWARVWADATDAERAAHVALRGNDQPFGGAL